MSVVEPQNWGTKKWRDGFDTLEFCGQSFVRLYPGTFVRFVITLSAASQMGL